MAADHRQRAPPEACRFRISLRSRCTAMPVRLRTLIHTRHEADRYMLSAFLDTMRSAPSWRAWANTVDPSSATCWFSRMPAVVKGRPFTQVCGLREHQRSNPHGHHSVYVGEKHIAVANHRRSIPFFDFRRIRDDSSFLVLSFDCLFRSLRRHDTCERRANGETDPSGGTRNARILIERNRSIKNSGRRPRLCTCRSNGRSSRDACSVAGGLHDKSD